MYLSCYNLFLQFLYYRRRNKRLRETVVSMLSCGALERSSNSHKESIVGLIGKKILKKGWGNGKKYPWAESGICVYVCEREKNNSFKIHVIILRYIRNVNLPFKKDFKFAELLTKTSFFLYFRDRPENGERNKQKRRRKYMRKSN